MTGPAVSLVREHVREVKEAVNRGVRPGAPESASRITRSWIRCVKDYGLDPGGKGRIVVLEAPEVRRRQAQLAELVSAAGVEMLNLYQQVSGSGFAIILTDAQGVILHYIGDPIFADTASKTGLTPGAVWDEQNQGTNGMGTCLAEQKPVVVHHNDHFFPHNTGLTCSAAPIFGPSGELVAALDASSASHLAQQHTLALVNMSAQTLENRLFLSEFKKQYVLRFHSRPEFVTTLGEGLLAFSDAGKLLAANRSALFQLNCKSRDDLCGRELDDLFNATLGGLMQRSTRNWQSPMPLYWTGNGSRFFATLNPPEHATRVSVPVATEILRPEKEGSPSADSIFHFDRLQFGDPVMAANVNRAMRILDRDIPLLIMGETGTGKEVFAKTFHYASARADQPFVAVNCSSIPESLIESELFGYRPGAFTGAHREGRRGKIVQANHGTLFLDEIGDMPLSLQSRLLRVLEEREVVSLGSETPVKVDFQLISATHRNLEELVRKGQFREDLFYRLQGLPVMLPALRERQDRRAVIRHLLSLLNEGDDLEVDANAMRLLESYCWPGNLRQLRNVLRTALALSGSRRITAMDLPQDICAAFDEEPQSEDIDATESAEDAGLTSLDTAMRETLIRELERNHWNITNVAQRLRVSRNTLYRKMKRLHIKCKSHETHDQ